MGMGMGMGMEMGMAHTAGTAAVRCAGAQVRKCTGRESDRYEVSDISALGRARFHLHHAGRAVMSVVLQDAMYRTVSSK